MKFVTETMICEPVDKCFCLGISSVVVCVISSHSIM